MIPILYSLLFDIYLFTFLSILDEVIIPIIIKIKAIKNDPIIDILVDISFIDSGIRENMDIDIMTPLDAARQKAMMVSLFFSLK